MYCQKTILIKEMDDWQYIGRKTLEWKQNGEPEVWNELQPFLRQASICITSQTSFRYIF